MVSRNTPSKTIIYTPESPLRHPRQLLVAMMRDLWMARILAWRLIVRDVSANYRQTALGYFWAILPPLVTAMLWIFLNYSQVLVVRDTGVPYAAYALTGTIFWQLFIDALNAPLTQVNANRLMLAKVNFPKEALVLSGIVQVFFSFFIKFVVLVVLLIILQVPIHGTVFLLVLPVSGFVLLGTVLGVLLVPIGMLYRDIQQGIGIVINPLMYLTPVVYPAPAVGILAILMRYNPLSPLFQLVRDSLFTGLPGSLDATMMILAITVVLAFSGWLVYRLALPILIERLDA